MATVIGLTLGFFGFATSGVMIGARIGGESLAYSHS